MSAVIDVDPGSHGPLSKVARTNLNPEEPRVIKRINVNFHFLLAALCTEGCRILVPGSSPWRVKKKIRFLVRLTSGYR
jgi:hypothetical protein